MSRQPKKRIVIQFIVTAKEKRALKAAARRSRQSLSAWLLAVAARHL